MIVLCHNNYCLINLINYIWCVYIFRWLTLLLSQEFSLPEVLRIWDSLFSDSQRFSFLIDICCAMIVYVLFGHYNNIFYNLVIIHILEENKWSNLIKAYILEYNIRLFFYFKWFNFIHWLHNRFLKSCRKQFCFKINKQKYENKVKLTNNPTLGLTDFSVMGRLKYMGPLLFFIVRNWCSTISSKF